MREYGCLMVLNNHPFLSGRPARVKALRSLVEYALKAGDVEITTGATIAKRVLSSVDSPVRRSIPVEVDPEVYPNL
jgi:hypothetical protein